MSRSEDLRVQLRLATDLMRLLPGARNSPALALAQRARKTPDEFALVFESERFTWSEVHARAAQYANFFAQEGVRPGEVVALLMDNRPDYLFAVLGLSQLGAISALINTQLFGHPLRHALEVSGAKRILAGTEHVDRLHGVLGALPQFERAGGVYIRADTESGKSPTPTRGRSIDAELLHSSNRPPTPANPPRCRDIFCYIYTSGTTGLPKAAIIRNQRMLGAAYTFARLMHRCGSGDTIYVPLPLYHSSAMFLGFGAALVSGAAIALRRRFSVSEFWDDVHRFDASSFLYIGELCRFLLNAPAHPLERRHRLRAAVGNGIRPEVWTAFQARFEIPIIREFYGSTEGNAPALNHQGRPGMIGRLSRNQVLVRSDPSTGELVRGASGYCTEVRPGEVGLLLGRISPLMSFEGYVDPEATRKKVRENVFKRGDRYFDSGDLLRLHEGRWVSFVDRVGDTYRYKGENVSTNEVAEMLNSATGVMDANVYGVTVGSLEGRAGMAALCVGANFELDAFAEYVRKKMPAHQQPLFIRLVSGAMEITATFKHRKVDYRGEGFDPGLIDDPVYALLGGSYEPVTTLLYAKLANGELIPGRAVAVATPSVSPSAARVA